MRVKRRRETRMRVKKRRERMRRGERIPVFLSHALKDPLKHAVGELHNVGLCDAGQSFAALRATELKGFPDDALCAGLSDLNGVRERK